MGLFSAGLANTVRQYSEQVERFQCPRQLQQDFRTLEQADGDRSGLSLRRIGCRQL